MDLSQRGGDIANEDRIIAVYMLANRRNGALYTGVTSHLIQRIWQHKTAAIPGFATRYGCKILVWFEVHDLISAAIQREKSLKSYRRQNKINLIEVANPDWCDLYGDLLG